MTLWCVQGWQHGLFDVPCSRGFAHLSALFVIVPLLGTQDNDGQSEADQGSGQ